MGQSLGFIKRKGEDTHRLHNHPPHPMTGEKCSERGVPAGPLQRLEVDVVERPCADQPFDLDHRLRAERGRERPLFPGSTGWLRSTRAAHNRSLTSVNSRVNCRKRRYSATCARTSARAASGML